VPNCSDPYCYNCSGNGTCYQCMAPYILNSATNLCGLVCNVSNCLMCSIASTNMCEMCMANYTLNNFTKTC
jgi:hypothetical protein